jgi:hypothetical protein
VLNWGFFPFFSPLHRDLLDWVLYRVNHGRFGVMRRLSSAMLYALFHLNARQRGDYPFVLALRAGATA